MGIVVPTPASFNMWVFKIPIPITCRGKIFPPYLPCCRYYPQVSVGADFFDIPSPSASIRICTKIYFVSSIVVTARSHRQCHCIPFCLSWRQRSPYLATLSQSWRSSLMKPPPLRSPQVLRIAQYMWDSEIQWENRIFKTGDWVCSTSEWFLYMSDSVIDCALFQNKGKEILNMKLVKFIFSIYHLRFARWIWLCGRAINYVQGVVDAWALLLVALCCIIEYAKIETCKSNTSLF